MSQDAYGSNWLKAAVLLQALALLAPLEQHNRLLAWGCAQMFLDVNGHQLKYKPDDALGRRPS
ncbi:hypothetical protein ACWD4B_21670 [Streptomyces sp. NPDC002536]